MSTYAVLGVRFEPADSGQLSIRVPSSTNDGPLELAAFGLKDATRLLARELGPGNLQLTHVGHDAVDGSHAAFATTTAALAFVVTRSETEVRAQSESLLQLPCRFEMIVKQAGASIHSGREPGDVTLAGPYLKGDLRVGDIISVSSGDSSALGRVTGLPMVNFGPGPNRQNWMAVEVADIQDFAPAMDSRATGPSHWRPQPKP